MIYAVLMAGGRGTRLWPISRRGSEKHLLSTSGGSLLLETFERIAEAVPAERVRIVTTQDQSDSVASQLADKIAYDQIIAEPLARGTAAALAHASMRLARGDPDPVVIALPCDHLITRTDDFIQSLGAGLKYLAKNDVFVTFGVKPDAPRTGFGYIVAGGRLDTPLGAVYKAARFVEKPDGETAARLLSSGGVYWNSGMFLFRARTYMNALKAHLPAHHDAFMEIFKSFGSRTEEQTILSRYQALESVSVDRGVMEKADNVVVVEATFDWRDVGSHDALPGLQEAESANRAKGDFVALDATGCSAWTDAGVVALVGVKDVTVVRCGDAVLVCGNDALQRVRDVVALLEKRGLTDYL